MDIYTEAKSEFKEIIRRYLIPLFDSPDAMSIVDGDFANKGYVLCETLADGKQQFRFFPSKNKRCAYCFEVISCSSRQMANITSTILNELLKVAEYRTYGVTARKQRDYGKGAERSELVKWRTMDLAFELGICRTLAPTYETTLTLHSIIWKMIEWSERTYEGKRVPFGLIVNLDPHSASGSISYLQFLENDSSAVFSDGVFSGISLDCKGHLLSFITRDSVVPEAREEKELFVPYQFADLAKHCVGQTVGIIVQTNGEILLVKNRALCYAKRGTKWVYFDWQRVYNSIRPFFASGCTVSDEEGRLVIKKIKAIYCTLLDVSFAHTGGCLAVVVNDSQEINTVVKDRIDLGKDAAPPQTAEQKTKEKIEVLKYLLSDLNGHLKSFYDVEKPLRKEIMSLDGATVVSLDGNFYCAGSIVSVPGGSKGGGRTAAAEKLAEFGVGIKISEDGYIEAYGTRIQADGSKSVISLFKIS